MSRVGRPRERESTLLQLYKPPYKSRAPRRRASCRGTARSTASAGKRQGRPGARGIGSARPRTSRSAPRRRTRTTTPLAPRPRVSAGARAAAAPPPGAAREVSSRGWRAGGAGPPRDGGGNLHAAHRALPPQRRGNPLPAALGTAATGVGQERRGRRRAVDVPEARHDREKVDPRPASGAGGSHPPAPPRCDAHARVKSLRCSRACKVARCSRACKVKSLTSCCCQWLQLS